MARETVQELIVRIKQEGLGNLEFLKKELKQVSSQSKISEKSIEGLQKEISKFGAATKNSVEGIKGQVSAFQKLRAQSDFQGRAYKSLTKDIISLNRELKNRLGIEKELDAGGRGRRGGSLSPGAGDRGLLDSKLDKNWAAGTSEQFSSRMASLQALLVTRTFENITDQQRKFLTEFKPSGSTGTYTKRDLKGSSLAFQKMIEESNVQFLKGEALHGKGRGIHTFRQDDLLQQGKLNKVQREALNIQEDLDIKSKAYLEVLAKINAEEGVQTRILSAQDAVAKNQVANIRARTIARDDQISQQQSKARSYLYQQEKALTGGILESTTKKGTAYGLTGMGPAEREFRGKPPIAQQIQGIGAFLSDQMSDKFPGQGWESWKSDTYRAMEKERTSSGRPYGKYTQLDKTDTSAKFPSFGKWSEGKNILPGNLAQIIRGGMGEPILSRKDPMGLGKDLAYPKTDTGFAAELNNLNELLPNLKRGSKEWVDTTLKIEKKQEELAETIKEGNEALKKRKQAIAEAVNPKVNQKLLPPGKPTLEEAMGGVKGQKFDSKKISKGMKNTSKSVDDLRRSILKKTSASNKSINKLNEQRNSLDKLRNSVAPNSSAFKQLTKDIDRTNKSLTKLQGSSKGFGKKGLLGFGQSVLGGAYFGGPFGAVGAGIGQMFGGQQGAATGGLVGAQVGRPVTEFIGGSTDYAAQYSKAQLTLKQITKDSGSYGVAMDAVKTAVEEFNVPQEVAIKGMTRLSAAVLGSGGNINNAAEAFLNTTAAIKGTAGSADDVKSAITAMVQIYSKGKVSAEELSGQLGERFPGAVTKFAKANDISTQSLQKNLKDGTVGLDMLSKFIESLGSEYIPLAKKIAASNEEAGARSRIAMNKLRIAVGEELIPIGKEFQEMTAELLIDLIPALTKLAEIGGDAFAALASSISFVVDNFNIIGPAIAGATASLVAYNIQQQITNRTGIAKILIQAWAAMTKLVAAIKAGTVAQVALNAVTAINPYVALAGVITSVATAIWGVKAASDALKGEETLLGDISGMTLTETKKTLKEVESTLKMYQDIINNPDTAPETRKGLSGYIDKLETQIAELQTQITKLGGKVVFDPLTGGAEDAGEKIYEGLSGGVNKFMDSMKKSGEELANITASWFDRMASSLADFVMTGKLKFKEFARSVIADIAKMIAQQMIFNILAGLDVGNWGKFRLGPNSAMNRSKDLRLMKGANGLVVAQNGIVPYAKGGIVNSPTLFPFSRGVGLMGEAGPEAVVPLKRGRDGKLGIAGGGGATTVNVSVDAKGTKVEGDGQQMDRLGRLLGSAIEAELVKQKRPGGLLA